MQITISSERVAEMRFLAERILDIVSKIEQSNAESTPKVEQPTPNVEKPSVKVEKPTRRVEKPDEKDVLDSFGTPPSSATEVYELLKKHNSYGTALIAFVNAQIGYSRGQYTKQQWDLFKYTFRKNPAELKSVVAELKRISECLKPLKFQKEVEPIVRKLTIEILQKGYGINAIRQFRCFLNKRQRNFTANAPATDADKIILLKYWFGCAVGYNNLETKFWADVVNESEIKPFVSEQRKLF